ncbi:YeeE/YedE family protein [Methylomonas paludis]|uniref:YeeE/YedE family protein n=1 Tax=Methylomonas paludis TaxID=1173101 RepID=A0A975R9G3_9GAMM|nr:DUF6691 family protein [Methylomonas paludis]QWF70204.1 YeeE/YedE family protein [Methylomonas paludis]
MLKSFSVFVIGLIFGLGLIVAQMSNPGKVLAFLDVAGDWDPSLALVMASALLILGGAQRWLIPTIKPILEPEQTVCGGSNAAVDTKLVIGAAIFGIGWGLSGICPGPALVGLSSGLTGFYVFGAAMFAGFWLFYLLHGRR